MSNRPNTFDKYFRTVMKEVKINASDNDTDEIRHSTTDLIRKIWNKALSKNEKFELSEVIPVGSMEEGSRLFSADEFDFMMILKMNDFPIDKIVIKEGCRPGFVRLLLEDPNVRLNECFKNNQLHSWEFRKHLLSQLQKVGDFSETSGNLRQIKRDLTDMGLRTQVQHALLQILGEHEIEAWNVLFKWHNTEISVDTMPAIEITREQIELFEGVRGSPLFHDDKHKDRAFVVNQTCYLVPKGCQKDDDDEGCGCWLIDFAPAEVAILKKMDKIHKDCQKFLKYLFKYYHKLPSYMVKSAVLKHIDECTDHRSEQSCTLDILNVISKRLDDANMPDPFLRNLNVFGWKEAGHLRSQSPTDTAIIFENHSRFVYLLLQTICKMTQENIAIDEHCVSQDIFELREIRAIEYFVPLNPLPPQLDIFMDKIRSAVQEFIAQKKWSTIAELRILTKPYLNGLKWDPIEDFKKLQLESVVVYPQLKGLIQYV
ncbi:uncharacterized protein [Mytilus edulis]|uniref:uncharacterized protein n=1 Tax=Mytilus edulis TaxID=6550 RepID=UPI0039EF571D